MNITNTYEDAERRHLVSLAFFGGCGAGIRQLTWVPLAELLRGCAHLAVHNTLILLLLRVRLEPLPRKAAPDEVH